MMKTRTQKFFQWKSWRMYPVVKRSPILHSKKSKFRTSNTIRKGSDKIGTSSFFLSQSPDFLKPGLCYVVKFLYFCNLKELLYDLCVILLKSGKRFVNGSGALVRCQKSRQSGIVVAW